MAAAPWTPQGPIPQHHEAPSPTASSWGREFSHSSWPGRDRGRCYQGRAGCRARGRALIIKSQFHYSNLSPRATQARLSQGARPQQQQQQHLLRPWGTGTPRVGGSSPAAAPAPCGVPAPGCLSPLRCCCPGTLCPAPAGPSPAQPGAKGAEIVLLLPAAAETRPGEKPEPGVSPPAPIPSGEPPGWGWLRVRGWEVGAQRSPFKSSQSGKKTGNTSPS